VVLRLLKGSLRKERASNEVAVEAVDPLAALARAAAGGDRDASRTLLVMLGPALLGTVRGVLGVRHPDVEDVLQETMTAVHAALPGFRAECRTVHFACRVAAQTAMNARRRAGYRTRITPSAAPEEVADLARDERSPADAHAANERREALRGLLDELPFTQAEALALHVVLGYSVDETAAATGTPRDTVRSRLRTALVALRKRVESDGALLELLGDRS
jgi:RNA polymerase sigma-70 factor (ECF subfamily)